MTTYSAVRTTGIYCRPGCGAKPLAENVETFEHAASAEAAGYRACLRCRPYRVAGPVSGDLPGLICRAVQLILDGALDEGTEIDLARQLAVSSRHLRRAFNTHLGLTPDALARSRRAHFARRLLDESDLSVSDVAFASGFGSIRSFNRAMGEVFRATPVELREKRRRSDRITTDGGVTMRLPFTAPYDWSAIAAYLGRHAIPGVESIDDNGVYRRTISLDGAAGMIELGPGGPDHLLLRAHLPFWEGLIHLVQRVNRLAAIDLDPVPAERRLADDPAMGALVAARPGVRIPGAWGRFETAVNVLVADRPDARFLLGDLAEQHGQAVPGLGFALNHLFPSAHTLAGASLGWQFPEVIGDLARAVAAGAVDLDCAESADALFLSLVRVRGIDAEVAQAIALRCGPPDAWRAFPEAHQRLFAAVAGRELTFAG